MSDGLRAAVVNASEEQLADLNERLAPYEFVPTTLDERRTPDWASDAPPGLLLVYGTDDAEAAVSLCTTLRKAPGMQDVPMLLAITQYQIFAGHELTDVPKCHFIFTPVERDELDKRLSELTAPSGADGGS